MNIVIKLEQSDFQGNRAVFDAMYGLCEVLNPRTEQDKRTVTKAEAETRAEVTRDEIPPSEPTQPASEDTETDFTQEQVRKAFGDLASAKGKDAAKGILSEMGYTKVTEIPKERYPEAMEKIKAVS